jgi:hypothetical protein
MDAKQQSAAPRTEAAKPAASQGSGKAIGIVIGLIVLAAVAFAALRYFGMV